MRWGWMPYLLLLGSVLLGACAKEDLSYPIQQIQVPTALSLTDLYLLDGQQGYLSGGTHFTNGMVWQTNDGGLTWDSLGAFGTGVYGLAKTPGRLLIGESGQTLHRLPDLFAINLAPELYSTAGWWAWHSLALLPSGRVLMAGGENFGRGFLHQYDPSTGAFSLLEERNNELRDLAVTADGAIHAVGHASILRAAQEGDTFTIAPIAGDFFQGIDFPTAEVGYVVGAYGAVYKTTNGGRDWFQCRAGTSVFANPNALLEDVAFVNEQEGFLVGTGGTVFRTTDGGQTWKQVRNLAFDIDYTAIRIQEGRAYLLGKAGKLVRIELE